MIITHLLKKDISCSYERDTIMDAIKYFEKFDLGLMSPDPIIKGKNIDMLVCELMLEGNWLVNNRYSAKIIAEDLNRKWNEIHDIFMYVYNESPIERNGFMKEYHRYIKEEEETRRIDKIMDDIIKNIKETDAIQTRMKYSPAFLSRHVREVMLDSKEFKQFVFKSIRRFRNMDFDSNSEENKKSIKEGGRIFSEYNYSNNFKIWIIMEENKPSLLVVFPSEY